ncbi:MAG TPA: septal ring lytic transglycosylase RlpA family protein, partial [Candidatus Binataceae bacterium]|nr:septal ring lytic transglycosylase RlpA family protein [Candidatus Binataceae bacterium]
MAAEESSAGGARWTRICALVLFSAAIASCATRQAPPPPSSFSPAPFQPSVVGIASWYGPGFDGHRTSSGEIYNQEDLTAASLLFPLGTRLMVTNLANGRAVEVTINDHGPYIKGRDIDLSHRAARLLGMIGPGTTRVRMDVMRTPPGGAPLGERYFVQVGSFSNAVNARRMGKRLAARYPDVRVVEADAGESRFYRVRMGAFASRDAARQRAAMVTRLG